MTGATRTMLEQWLESGTDIQRQHATWRLSLPDVPDTEPEPFVPIVPVSEVLAGLRIIRRCGYRNATGCGCTGARCGLRGSIVSHRDCLECVRRYGDS